MRSMHKKWLVKIILMVFIVSDTGDLMLSIIVRLHSDPQDLKLRYVKVIVSDTAKAFQASQALTS